MTVIDTDRGEDVAHQLNERGIHVLVGNDGRARFDIAEFGTGGRPKAKDDGDRPHDGFEDYTNP